MLKALLGLCALAAAAWGGAQWQARLAVQAAPLDPARQYALAQRLDRDATLIDDSIAGLATKLGELQARLIAMDAVRQRVSDAAGLAYSAPELHTVPDVIDAMPVMDDIPPESSEDMAPGTAEALGRRIDALRGRVAAQEDAFSLIDAAMSSRAGLEAGLPTLMPVDYPYLSSSFGWRRNPVSGRHSMHEGLDFVAPRGTPIRAASGGLVLRARSVRGYGKMVEIDHGNGLTTRYAHASSLAVRPGDLVRQGQLIARVGNTGRSTGPHLHFEVRMAGYPLDPTLFLGAPADRPDLRLAHSGAPADTGTSHATASQLR